jgi:hypothetical protein
MRLAGGFQRIELAILMPPQDGPEILFLVESGAIWVRFSKPATTAAFGSPKIHSSVFLTSRNRSWIFGETKIRPHPTTQGSTAACPRATDC